MVSDIHASKTRFAKLVARMEHDIGRRLGPGDTIICLGDLLGARGSNRPNTTRYSRDAAFIDWIESLPFEVTSILGNHDTKRRLWLFGAFSDELYGGPVLRLANNVTYMLDGNIYEISIGTSSDDDTSTVVSFLPIGGALAHFAQWGWGSAMLSQEMGRHVSNISFSAPPVKVDYVLSHDSPGSAMGFFAKTVFGIMRTNELLDEAAENISYKEWFFGHHHMDIETKPGFHGLYEHYVAIGTDNEGNLVASRPR